MKKELQEAYGKYGELATFKIVIESSITEDTVESNNLHDLRNYLTSQLKVQKRFETPETTEDFMFSEKITRVVEFFDKVVLTMLKSNPTSPHDAYLTTLALQDGVSYKPVPGNAAIRKNISLDFIPNSNEAYDLIMRAYKHYEATEKKEEFLQFYDIVKTPKFMFSNPVRSGRAEAIMLYQSFFAKDLKLISQSNFSKKKEEAYLEQVDFLENEISTQNKNLIDFTEDLKEETSREVDEKVIDFQNRYESIEASVNDQLGETQKKFNDIQSAYEQKLSFEAPIKHWKEQSKSRAWYAFTWAGLAIVALVFLIFLVKWFLVQLYSSTNLTNTSIPQYFVPIAFISLLIYLLRVFINIAVSNWHMSSEYSQKAALTTYYISMLKEGHVSEEEKALVLPALFSKIDTGLNKYQDNSDITAFQTMSNLLHK